MKIKIQEPTQNVVPRLINFGQGDVFSLKIVDNFKYLVLPVEIVGPVFSKVKIIPPLLIFYDGDKGGITQLFDIRLNSERKESIAYNNMQAKFMPFVQLKDPYYYWVYDRRDGIPGLTAGWEGGLTANGSLRFAEGYNTNAFNYVTYREIQGLVRSLTTQGVTAKDQKYVYINWTEDYRDIGGFGWGVMTGPSNNINIIDRGNGVTFEQPRGLISEDNQRRTEKQNWTDLVYTIAKIIDGGTGTDGIYFRGLRHYFPKCKFGVYSWPTWNYYFHDGKSITTRGVSISERLNFYANAWVDGLSGAVDSFDMWMPSFYCSLNSIGVNRVRSVQGMSLCNKINQILESRGKKKKLIVPFIHPIWNTISTGTPYQAPVYDGFTYAYTPPYTIMSDEDINTQLLEPIVEANGDGATIWMNTDYRKFTILGRLTNGNYEDFAPQPSWRKWPFLQPGGTTFGINQWSEKSLQRQAVSSYYNYIKGVCLGITGTRWWWATASQNTTPTTVEQFTPPEWLPLGLSLAPYGNKVLYSQGGVNGSTSSYATQLIVEEVLEDAKIRTINNFKSLWYKKYS